MTHWKTHTANTQNQLTQAGYSISKNVKDSLWEMKDGSKVVMSNKALGDLVNKASKEFGI